MKRIIIYSLTILLINSCAYKTKNLTTIDNKKVRVRFYKDTDMQEAYENKHLFKRTYSKMTFEKYNGKILSDTIYNFTFFQFDSIRVYIDNIPIDGNQGLKYSDLIKSGLISPKIISCALNPVCIIPQDSVRKMAIRKDTVTFTETFLAFDTCFLKKKYSWTGSKIYISNIKELPYIEKKTTRVFELEHKIYHGGPIDAYYYVEITNDKADNNTSFSDFVKGARLTFLKHTNTVIEL